ncbi:MAG: hypothetical protein E7447_01065 [Ruminococcaceae bacterium]|nr:hypothetical protein [Oscillospiraceae bacterium]
MSRINNRNKPFFETLFSPIIFTIIQIREICIFVRDFSEIIANPYSLVWEIFCQILFLLITIFAWHRYLAAKKNKGEETPSE